MSTLRTTRTFLFALGLVAAVLAGPAPSAHAFGLGGGTAADVEATKNIRELYASFVKDWNNHDVAAMASRWAIDGDAVEPDGQVAKGRDEVTALMTRQHTGVFKDTTLALEVKSVWMISDAVALVDGTYELTGAKLPDGTAVPPRKGLLTSVLIMEKGSWSIAASRLMVPTILPYKSRIPVSKEDAAAPKQP